MILATHGIVANSGIVSVDIDAQAFITATGITDSTQKSAINQLVLDLKSYGIWSKRKAIYPFVGGTASTHKWNLKDPRDLDVAFRLTFAGGMSHNSNGIVTNGSTSYANTYLTPNSVLNINSSSFDIYSRTNGATDAIDLGSYSGGNGVVDIYLRFTTGNMLTRIYSTATTQANPNVNTIGFFSANRLDSVTAKQLRNGVVTNTATITSVSMPTLPLFIGSLNNQGTSFGSTSRQFAFVSIGDGLTDVESANFYTAVQTFQTTLGRQV